MKVVVFTACPLSVCLYAVELSCYDAPVAIGCCDSNAKLFFVARNRTTEVLETNCRFWFVSVG